MSFGCHSSAKRDDGFTLVELLIVIVILGVLSTVVVFAVRTVSGQAEEAACATELKTLATAQVMHFTTSQTFAAESALVSTGALREESSLFDTTGDADGYTISPAVGSVCTATTNGGSSAGGTTPPPPPPPMTGSFNWHGGVDAWRLTNDANGGNEIVVIGGATGWADWSALEAAGTASPRRTHFVDIASLDPSSLDQLLVDVNNTGVTTLVLYSADDATPIGGATNVADYLTGSVNRLSAYPLTTLQSVGAGGLAGVVASTPA